MPAYEITNIDATAPAQTNVAATYKTMFELHAQTAFLRRMFIFELSISFDAQPANNSITCDISRFTAVGTGVAGVINPCDPADGAAASAALINDTVEPNYTANSSVWARAINQQLSFTWGALGAASQLIGPAVNANGLGLRMKSAAYASTSICGCKFED